MGVSLEISVLLLYCSLVWCYCRTHWHLPSKCVSWSFLNELWVGHLASQNELPELEHSDRPKLKSQNVKGG